MSNKLPDILFALASELESVRVRRSHVNIVVDAADYQHLEYSLLSHPQFMALMPEKPVSGEMQIFGLRITRRKDKYSEGT